MTIQTIQKKANACGLQSRQVALTSGNTGIFVSYEYEDEYGQARLHPLKVTLPFERYLKRYKIPYEYRANYTSILILGDDLQ